MSKITQDLEKARMTREVPDFKPGDTVTVQVKVVYGRCKLNCPRLDPRL